MTTKSSSPKNSGSPAKSGSRPRVQPKAPDDRPSVFTDASEYGVGKKHLHSNVFAIANKLREAGYEALVVGGAVRDLVLGNSPKDFDVATSARPEAVKRLFRNARIIGRRFRLVHINYPNMTVEVATFRGVPQRDGQGLIHRDNTFGTSRQDAFRRDFTMNALSLDPLTMQIIDHVGGMDDLQQRVIRTISPPEESFREDPVRMLRAVRFMVRLGFKMEPSLEQALRGHCDLLTDISRHRLAEEIQRFLVGGYALGAFDAFHTLGLLQPLLGLEAHPGLFPGQVRKQPLAALEPYLRTLDTWAADKLPRIAPTVALLGLLTVLGRPAFRDALRGKGSNASDVFANRRGGELYQRFGDWGLLNGQIAPALTILRTAQAILADTGNARAPTDDPSIGAREAWILLALMAETLSVPEALIREGLGQLEQLPEMPILDHHLANGQNRASRRGAKKGNSRHSFSQHNRSAKFSGGSSRSGNRAANRGKPPTKRAGSPSGARKR